MQYPFILASASPRRLALLADIGLVPDQVLPADIDETPRHGELPRQMAARLAREKGEAIVARCPGSFVLSADTVVAVGRRSLPKAETQKDVSRFLGLLSGRRHRVFTGVTLWGPDGKSRERLSESVVSFKRLTVEEIEAYAACGEGIGKAGGYAIQGRAAASIRSISGSYSNIVGLPLFEVAQMFSYWGLKL